MPGTIVKVCPDKRCVGVIRRDGIPHCAACGSTAPPDEVELPIIIHPLTGQEYAIDKPAQLHKLRDDLVRIRGLCDMTIDRVDEALAEPPIHVLIAE